MKIIRYAFLLVVPLAVACGSSSKRANNPTSYTTTTGVELDTAGRPCATDKNDLDRPPPQAYGGPARGTSPTAPESGGALGSGGGGTSSMPLMPTEAAAAIGEGCPKTQGR